MHERPMTGIDLFTGGFPHEVFARHRAEAPVYWHEPTAHTPDGEGFWSVGTYDLTRAVLRDEATFSSETGGDRPCGGTLLADLPIAGVVLNMMDDPRHARVRRLVSAGLTRRVVLQLEEQLRERVRAILAALPEYEPFDVGARLRRRADAADHLHPARGAGGRPARAARRGRGHVRHPRR